MSEETVEERVEENLTPEESQEFQDLLTIGFISDTVDVFGHEVRLSTLSTREDIAIGLLLKEFIGSSSYERAYRSAVVASALREVDGELFVPSLKKDANPNDTLKLKFKKINEYAPLVVDVFYKEFTNLETKLLPIVSRLGKTSS